MVESGPMVSAAFIAVGFINEHALFRADITIGNDGLYAFKGMLLTAITMSPRFRLVRITRWLKRPAEIYERI